MNTERIESDKEEVLKIVNEDWPMLEELGKKRFVINKKKTKDVQESLNVLQAVLDEDSKLAEIPETPELKEIPVVENTKVEVPVLQKVKDEKIVVAQEVQKTPSSQTQKPATTITQSEIVAPVQQEEAQVKVEQTVQKLTTPRITKPITVEKTVVTEKSIDLFKLIIAGLTHLYVSKTSNLLKPLKFVMENYKEVSIAALHFIVPLLMTYFITTHVGFVTEQLVKETMFMKVVYIGVFFFGATFVWITSQVLLSGLYSMVRKSMLDVAKVGKENQ